LNKEEIELGIGDDYPSICYKLTTQGGAKWESLYNPNWNRYYTYINVENANHQLCIAGGSSDILKEFLAYQIAHPFKKVDINSIKWEILEPWDATYWKTLPIGYQVSYLAEDIPYNSQEDIIKTDMFDFCFFQWKHVNKWYTNPKFN
jgi:hypothetical protein